jgi:alcohol dehydrogenase (cytochrome c)
MSLRSAVCGLPLGFALAGLSLLASAQGAGLDPATLLNPGTDAWPTYNGDYSGRRFSSLDRINTGNVKSLSLAWIHSLGGGPAIKATPLLIDGTVYLSTQDNAYAIDARTGRRLWHYAWTSQGGNHLSNRGMGALGETLYFETPDCHLVALRMTDGSHLWDTEICDLDRFYYASTAPVVIKNHVIAGVSGDDLDNPGYLEAHDPVTGALQWRWWTVPQSRDDPGADTWPNEDAAKHGGGMTWQPVTYDPELNLIYVTTGNPQPVIAWSNREGANLFTGSIVALDADTGRMVWYFQTSPHDTHDWDSNETAVLIDGTIDGVPRKLIAQAARNGHFFVLDRTNGKAIVSREFVDTNWSLGYDQRGQPIPNLDKRPQVDGVLVSPNQGGAANWQSPTFSPQTGLFYVNATQAYSVYYLYDPSDNPLGWGGTDRGGYSESMLQAIDYRTGEIRWSHPWDSPNRSSLLSTAGHVIFTGGSGGLEALDATTGEPLWHSRIGTVTNGPITYELDGQQYVVVAAGTSIFAFVMNQ